MERKRFEELVTQAVEGLPENLREAMENIVILVQEWPSQEQMEEVGIKRRQDLFGLYEGIPLPKRGRGYNMVTPDRITIFQKPIEIRYHNDDIVRKKIRSTVRHEIAHYFGISDDRLREMGRY